jgi:hypothetical protein
VRHITRPAVDVLHNRPQRALHPRVPVRVSVGVITQEAPPRRAARAGPDYTAGPDMEKRLQ